MKSSEPQGTVASCFIDLLAYVFFLRRICARRQPQFEDVKARVDQRIEESARRMRAYGIDPRDYDDARFAVLAWVDETILNMPWSQREQWTRALLQVRYYNTTNAGEEFFERLNRLRSDEKPVREVYYLCLSLGFRGRYHSDGDEFLLEQLRKSNLKSILGASRELNVYASAAVFPRACDTQWSATGKRPAGRFWTLPRIAFAATPAGLLLLLFLVYNFVLNGVAGTLLTRVQG